MFSHLIFAILPSIGKCFGAEYSRREKKIERNNIFWKNYFFKQTLYTSYIVYYLSHGICYVYMNDGLYESIKSFLLHLML